MIGGCPCSGGFLPRSIKAWAPVVSILNKFSDVGGPSLPGGAGVG